MERANETPEDIIQELLKEQSFTMDVVVPHTFKPPTIDGETPVDVIKELTQDNIAKTPLASSAHIPEEKGETPIGIIKEWLREVPTDKIQNIREKAFPYTDKIKSEILFLLYKLCISVIYKRR